MAHWFDQLSAPGAERQLKAGLGIERRRRGGRPVQRGFTAAAALLAYLRPLSRDRAFV